MVHSRSKRKLMVGMHISTSRSFPSFAQPHYYSFVAVEVAASVVKHLLAVGTKLEHVITQLAQEVAEKHVAVKGELLVQPSDSSFWFKQHKAVLFLIHIILFQNSFELTFFFWIAVRFNKHFHKNMRCSLHAISGIDADMMLKCWCNIVSPPALWESRLFYPQTCYRGICSVCLQLQYLTSLSIGNTDGKFIPKGNI
ncbi:hypothetical protein K2173_009316 [Erythroxylum novogranatense]|uniref:Uncharacterized protein n=1 Tax=Erythroxylum novogranatense TaxID=1862640 RepID=A0AAV8U6C9_9ROSI|nr:hypothetical protein K2173_009316 [Erythroxylum novogranatense]